MKIIETGSKLSLNLKWSDSEIQYVKEYYPYTTSSRVSEGLFALGFPYRSEKAVRFVAQKLGLRKVPKKGSKNHSERPVGIHYTQVLPLEKHEAMSHFLHTLWRVHKQFYSFTTTTGHVLNVRSFIETYRKMGFIVDTYS